jgi:hypothetical protein
MRGANTASLVCGVPCCSLSHFWHQQDGYHLEKDAYNGKNNGNGPAAYIQRSALLWVFIDMLLRYEVEVLFLTDA